jgi:hypothetical protein
MGPLAYPQTADAGGVYVAVGSIESVTFVADLAANDNHALTIPEGPARLRVQRRPQASPWALAKHCPEFSRVAVRARA